MHIAIVNKIERVLDNMIFSHHYCVRAGDPRDS